MKYLVRRGLHLYIDELQPEDNIISPALFWTSNADGTIEPARISHWQRERPMHLNHTRQMPREQTMTRDEYYDNR
jgi:hypothetical protein